ncbi:MAG TPA: UDPGP type 1 family protein [Deltaproteobacteria bacterium]|nr:UDPGP type 1 family protein [Deltaproteobacteria bacterium]
MLVEKLRELGQEHIARLLSSEADPVSRRQIAGDLEGVDLDLAGRLITGSGIYSPPGGEVNPAEVITATFASSGEASRYVEHGIKLLRQGNVAALVVAGGQGSRLGIEAPKGMVEVTPSQGKTLFTPFAEKILALERRYRGTIPWFIMTSRQNDGPTREYFHRNRFFGLGEKNVHFFVQGMLPSVTEEGKFLVSETGGLFMNPDGHGGTFNALRRSGSLNRMKDLGVEEIFYFQVDNPLVRICDPLFIGLHNLNNAQMSSKIVRKVSFEEKVGVIVRQAGRTCLLEYSDMGDKVRYARDEAGNMLHWAGNLAIHMIRRDFAEDLTEQGTRLPYHRARKKIVARGPDGTVAEVQGIKFETFLFDALPLAERSITLEVIREEEFAPVKNLTGMDSLESSKLLQTGLHLSWLRRLGIEIADGVRVEVSPLFALDFDELRSKADRLPRSITQDTYFG